MHLVCRKCICNLIINVNVQNGYFEWSTDNHISKANVIYLMQNEKEPGKYVKKYHKIVLFGNSGCHTNKHKHPRQYIHTSTLQCIHKYGNIVNMRGKHDLFIYKIIENSKNILFISILSSVAVDMFELIGYCDAMGFWKRLSAFSIDDVLCALQFRIWYILLRCVCVLLVATIFIAFPNAVTNHLKHRAYAHQIWIFIHSFIQLWKPKNRFEIERSSEM